MRDATRRGWTRAAAPALAISVLAVLLVGCQATEGARQSAAIGSARPALAAPPTATRPAPPPVPAAQALFSFDGLLGIPTNKADTLSRGIGNYARSRSLNLVRRGDPTATYHVRGFLSAVGGTGDTTVSYVWDIFDTAGNRVHRITGTEIAERGSADPWSGVSDQVLTAIAARTVEGVNAWINQSPGGASPVASSPAVQAI
jgi:hypothetical protein